MPFRPKTAYRENDHAHMIAFDFGVCVNEETGEHEPRLIEMQGFPTLFGFQSWFRYTAAVLSIPENYTQYPITPGILTVTICVVFLPAIDRQKT